VCRAKRAGRLRHDVEKLHQLGPNMLWARLAAWGSSDIKTLGDWRGTSGSSTTRQAHQAWLVMVVAPP